MNCINFKAFFGHNLQGVNRRELGNGRDQENSRWFRKPVSRSVAQFDSFNRRFILWSAPQLSQLLEPICDAVTPRIRVATIVDYIMTNLIQFMSSFLSLLFQITIPRPWYIFNNKDLPLRRFYDCINHCQIRQQSQATNSDEPFSRLNKKGLQARSTGNSVKLFQ